jgi:hypothetical protein
VFCSRSAHYQAPVTPDLVTPDILQSALALAGGAVAFLLGRELATGYQQWRARRDDQEAPRG